MPALHFSLGVSAAAPATKTPGIRLGQRWRQARDRGSTSLCLVVETPKQHPPVKRKSVIAQMMKTVEVNGK